MQMHRSLPVLVVIALVLAAGCTGAAPNTRADTSKTEPTMTIIPLRAGDGGGGSHGTPATTAVSTMHAAVPVNGTGSVTVAATTTPVTTTKTPVNYGAPVVGAPVATIGIVTQIAITGSMNPVTVVGCTPGTSPCGSRCVNLTADPANCGACGRTCPAAAPACNAGTCSAAGR